MSEVPLASDIVLGWLREEPEGALLPPSFTDRIKDCTAAQLVQDRRCGDLPVLAIDAERMPYIARNVSLHWQRHPDTALLTKASYKRERNYR